MTTKFSGYMGQVLDVDLSSGFIGLYAVSDSDREKFLGGRYLATKILYDQLLPKTDPLSPDNILVVMTSPLTGTGAPSSSRYNISAKSPQTGAIGHSNSGGSFGMHLKRAGFDGVVVRGRAEKPVYLEIRDGEAKIRDASALWGKDTHATQEALGKGGTLAIGPAGENRVRFASVVSQERSHGRTGMGAVMGSKNLKGMVASGKNKAPLAEPKKFKEHIKKWSNMLREHPATGGIMPKYGTAVFVRPLNKGHALPTKNFTYGRYDGMEKISGERLAEEFLTKNYGCVSCPIKCGRKVMLHGKEVKGPEYEVLSMLGSNLLIDDLPAIIEWNHRLDLLGMDTISLGNTLGFAAQLKEEGLWDAGIGFGDKEAVTQLIEDIAYRKGTGEELSKGVRFLSEKYGGRDFAAHSKGLELAAYDPRACHGQGLGYATSARGGCHLDAGYMVYFEINGPLTLDPLHFRSKPAWVVFDQNLLGAVSAGGNCLFTSWTALPPPLFKLPHMPRLSKLVQTLLTVTWPAMDATVRLPASFFKVHLPFLPHSKALELATGMEMDLGKFLQVGSRGSTLDRMFNLREGITARDDRLARRFTEEPLAGAGPKYRLPLSKMIKSYYSLRGWDAAGVPTRKTIRKLGL